MSGWKAARAAALVAALVAAAPPGVAGARVDVPNAVAVLRGLDKITARARTFEVRVGETARFGTLEIRVEACFTAPPIEPREAAAFLVVDAVDPGRPRTRAFSGWMFASSPSLSALEHPVYDVWVLDCREPLAPPAEEAESGAASPAALSPPPAPPAGEPEGGNAR